MTTGESGSRVKKESANIERDPRVAVTVADPR